MSQAPARISPDALPAVCPQPRPQGRGSALPCGDLGALYVPAPLGAAPLEERVPAPRGAAARHASQARRRLRAHIDDKQKEGT